MKKKNKISPNLLHDVDTADLFQRIVDQIGDEVMMIHSNGRIAYANQATARALGLPLQEIVGKSITKFFKEKISLAQWQKRHFFQLRRKKIPISYVVERVGSQGKVELIDITAVYMKYQNQEYVLSVARDISDRIKLQNKLTESENLYRLISEQAADGIFTLDLQGKVVYANKASEGIFKLDLRKSRGQHFIRFVEAGSQKKAWDCFRKALKGETTVSDELDAMDAKKNIIPIEISVSPLYRHGKIFQIHVICRDASKRRQFESLMRKSEKMKALQHFIAGTAQEIQYPLKGLSDRAKSLIDKYKERDFEYIGFREFNDIMRTLEAMRDQIKYCFETTQELVSISKRRVGLKQDSCHVNDVIRESAQMLEHYLEISDVKLRLQLASRLPQVAIGSLDLNQVIINILNNAIQSIHGQGGVCVKTVLAKKENAVKIICKDEGVGIPKEIISQIFEPFFTTKQRGLEKNSGLGLSIVYSILRAHQGDINIKSSLRRGTVAEIFLPIYKKPRV